VVSRNLGYPFRGTKLEDDCEMQEFSTVPIFSEVDTKCLLRIDFSLIRLQSDALLDKPRVNRLLQEQAVFRVVFVLSLIVCDVNP